MTAIVALAVWLWMSAGAVVAAECKPLGLEREFSVFYRAIAYILTATFLWPIAAVFMVAERMAK